MNKKQKKKCQKLANRHRPNHDKFVEMPVMNWDRKIVGYWHMPERPYFIHRGVKYK